MVASLQLPSSECLLLFDHLVVNGSAVLRPIIIVVLLSLFTKVHTFADRVSLKACTTMSTSVLRGTEFTVLGTGLAANVRDAKVTRSTNLTSKLRDVTIPTHVHTCVRRVTLIAILALTLPKF